MTRVLARLQSFSKTAPNPADGLAILVAISLPWSTSATSILVAAWIVALLPTLKWSELKEEGRAARSAVPLLLFGFALLSISWSNAEVFSRLEAMRPLVKLLALPLLFVQFRKSDKAHLVVGGYLISCTVLVVASLVSLVFPIHAWDWGFKYPGVPVKTHILQDAEFALCGFGLLLWADTARSQQRYRRAVGLAVWASLFFTAILYVDPSRTDLLSSAVLLALVSYRLAGWRGVASGSFVAILVFGAAWISSPHLRFRVTHVTWELRQFDRHDRVTSSGIRLEFWRKSLKFIRDAPVLGNGVGGTRELFAADARGAKGTATAAVTVNPFNQILATGIELGLVGIALLLAMWFVHFGLFRPAIGLPWLGALVVAQNVMGSLFNSHLYDFTQGWTYIFGVGVLGGLLVRCSASERRAKERRFSKDSLFALWRKHDGVSPSHPVAMASAPFGWGFYVKRTLIMVHDLVATAVALLAAFYIRFVNPAELNSRLHWLILGLPVFLAIAAGVYGYFRLYSSKWRFASLPDIANIVKAASALALVLLVLDYVLISRQFYGDFFFGKVTIAVYWVLQIFLLGGPRVAYRLYRHYRTRQMVAIDAIATLVLGRADDAEILIRAVENGAVKKIRLIGILSPSNADQRQVLRGIRVLGRIGDLDTVVRQLESRGTRIEEVIFTPSSLARENRPEEALSTARRLGLTVRRLPSLEERGEMRLAPVKVEDLLLRPSVDIDYERLRHFVCGKAVIVTGGGGSIGSELCDRVLTFGVGRLLVIDSSEFALYSVLERLKQKTCRSEIEGRIADVRDRERTFRLFNDFRPDLVFHAAALKHVPLLEQDCEEGIRTNVFGSVNVANAAVAAKATAMVMISTDKAIEPVSILGASKRLAEIYCQALDADLASKTKAGELRTRLISVRFGNVLASNGSVVPKFKAQIEAGGPVTVTHPDMVRYFMTIKEACDLVITASSHALGAERTDAAVYVLEMGQPIKIVDLAERLIRLAGFEPGHDIDIVFSGVRPGERLNEILFANLESVVKTGLAGIQAAKPAYASLTKVNEWLDELNRKIVANDRDAVLNSLRDAVPDFSQR